MKETLTSSTVVDVSKHNSDCYLIRQGACHTGDVII